MDAGPIAPPLTMATTRTELRRLLERLLPRRRPSARELLPALWFGALPAMEVVGRRSSSDVVDAPLVLVLVALVTVTWREHVRSPFPWVERFLVRPGRALAGKLERLGFAGGSDLRREPPLPRRTPPAAWVSGAVAAALVAVLVAAAPGLPSGARDGLSGISGALYEVALAALWVVLAAGSLFAVLLPPVLLQTRLAGRGRRRSALVTGQLFAGYLALLAVLLLFLPRWIPLAASAAVGATAVAVRLLPGRPRLDMIWRRGGDTLAVCDLAVLDVWRTAMAWCALATVSLVAGGERMLDLDRPTTMALTANLSALFTWSGGAIFCLWMGSEVAAALRLRAENPETPRRPTVRLLGLEGPESELRLGTRAVLEERGFGVRFDDDGSASPTEVPLQVTRAGPSEPADPFALSEHWPIHVAASEVASERVGWKLARRHEVLCRRHLLRGLRRALRRVPRSERDRALGAWINPHQAFSESLWLESADGEGAAHAGPPWREVMPIAARSHLFGVLRRLEVDLLFVERGVGHKQLRRVFGILFEVYDVHAGNQRAEERHFVGLEGLRVVLDEVTPLAPVGSASLSGYPEPDYEDIGRARILHVFRDRGEGVESAPRTPRFDDVPTPGLVPVG